MMGKQIFEKVKIPIKKGNGEALNNIFSINYNNN